MIKNSVLILSILINLISLIRDIKFNFINNQKTISYNEFIDILNKDIIKKIIIKGTKIFITDKQNFEYITEIPLLNKNLISLLLTKNIKIISKNSNIINNIFFLVVSILLFTIIIFCINKKIFLYFKNIFLTSKTNIFNNKIKTKFSDIVGNEFKEEVKEIIDYLKNPNKFKRLGGKLPKGILLIGPPGTGKTLLAKAIAGESNVPFFNISGSEFIEMFVGVGASRVREIFNKAKNAAPSIIFIDEIDSIGRQRGLGVGGGHDEREQTLNQMLIEMDGFNNNESVIVIAATNRPNVLDKALLRSGRFDRKIIIDLPSLKDRIEILKIYINKNTAFKNIDIENIAKNTYGFSGADLANLVNESILIAVRNNKNIITTNEFDLSIDRIVLGLEKKSLIITKEEKESIAYHESGHVIISKFLLKNQNIHKVTIIPKGDSLGSTMFIEDEDIVNLNKEKLENKICILYGGRIAEEIIYGSDKISTGSFSDIKSATNIARNMILKWGYSDILAPIIFLDDEDNNYINIKNKHISENILEIIDKEILDIVNRNIIKTRKILLNNIDILNNMKDFLIKYESLNNEQIDSIINRNYID